MIASPPIIRFDALTRIPGIEHAISTRHGGTSSGRWATMNTSYTVDDDPANVDANLDRLADFVGTSRERLHAAYQVHGTAASVVDAATSATNRPRCDILLTRTPGRTLMMRYADCAPILLADPVLGAVALVHAGWRGTALGAAGSAVEAMRLSFGSKPEHLVAAIGPAIGPCCYTVGDEVVNAFADRPWALVRPQDAGQVRLDLWKANQRGLEAAGVPSAAIQLAGICTMCHADEYFSHRANMGKPAGRFAALIRLV